MRSAVCSLVLGFVWALPALVQAAESQADPPVTTVYLDGPSDLARLRATNPRHFAQAQRILAAANQLCRPGPEEVQFANLDVRNLRCLSMLLKTSNPPKRQIEFRLDDVHYVALVAVTNDSPRVVRPGR